MYIDICHAYHIMIANGIPAEQIIVFAYDDIASSSQNPFPGQIFNKPNGADVYAGCNIDYKGSDVNPSKFLAVIQGDESAGPKVLKSNSKSKVFINFSDHGAPGLIAFPVGELYATDFHAALLNMNSKQMYDEMVVYIEACESGSMFDNILESNLKIYATTAANPDESSWATYCSPNDVVNGVHIGSCLGDEYSVNWMEDSDAQNLCSESLSQQFSDVQASTHDSHVMEYGDSTFKDEVVGNFQGTCDSQTKVRSFLKEASDAAKPRRHTSTIDSRLAKIEYLYNKFMRTQSSEDAKELENELANRRRIEERFAAMRSRANVAIEAHPQVQNFECYRALVDTYKNSCGLDEYDLVFFNHFVSMCNAGMNSNAMFDIVSSNC